MLFTKLIASKLTEYLGNVVVIDQCLIGINVWSASIVLHNVKLNLEGQKIFGIAEVEHGTIGSVSISFPWKSLFRARCEVRVDDVSIVLKQAANSTGNPQRRDGFLDNIRTEKSSAQSGFLCRIGQSIVQNLVFSAQNLRISYVDSAVNGGNSVHLSIYVPRISCEPASNDSLTEAGSISRAVHSDSIRIEVKTDETSLGRRSVLDGNCFLEVKEVIFDVSGTLDSPYRADCSLSCRNARMSISASVVQAVTQLCVSVLNLSESQRPPNRPHARPLANGSSWWKYAAIRIINRNRKRQQPFNWARYKLWKDGIQAYYLTCLIDLSAPWLTLDDTSEAGHTSTCLSSSDKLSCETFAQVAIREFEKNGRPPHWRGMWEPIGMREETTLALSAQIAVKCNHLTVSIGGVDIVVDNATSEAVLQQGKVVSQIGMLRQLTISVPSLQQSRALLFGAAGDRSVEWLFCEEKQHVSIPMSLIDVNGSSTPMLISELIAFSEEVISVIRQYDVIVTDEIPAKNGAQGCEETELFSAACRVDIDEIIVTLANASIVAAGVCFIVSNQPTASVSEIAVNSMEGHPLFIGHTMHVIAPISNCVRVELLNANLEPNYLATVESIKLELVSLANNIRSQLSGQRAIISEDTTSRKRVGSAVSVIVRIPTLSCHELEANDVSIEISIRNGWKIVVGAQGIGSDRYFSEDASIALSLWADDYVFETSYKDCIDADGIVFSVVASDLELVLDENLSGTIESIYDLIALLVFKEEDSHVYLKNDELRTPHICGNVDISRSCVHLIGAAHTVYPLECIAKGDNCVQVQVERFSDKRMSISVSLDDGLCIQLEETGAAPINILPSYSTACQNSENAIQVQIHLEPPSSVDFPHFSYTRMRLIVDMKRRAFAAHVPTIMTIWWQFSNPIQPLWRVRTVASRIHFSNLSSRGKSIPLRSPTSRQMADFGFAAQQYYVPPGKQPRSMIGDGGCRYSSPTFPMDLLIDLRATNSKLFYPLRDGSMAPLFLGFRVSQCHLQLLNRDCLSHLEVHGKLSPPRVRWTTLPDHDHYEEVNRHSATNSAAEMCLKLLYTHDTRPPHDAGVAKEAMNISIVGSYGGVSTPPVAVHLTDSDAAAWITLFTFSNSASPQVGSSLLRPQPQCTAASPPRQYTIDVRISPLVVVVPSIGLATALWDGLHLTFTQTGGQIRAPSGVSLIWHPSLHQHEPVDLSLQRLRQLHVSGWAPVAVGPWPAHGGATSTNRTCESPVALDVRFTQDGVGSGGKEIGVHVGSLQLHQSISSLWECQQAGVKEHIFGILALVHHQKAFLTSLEEQRARRFDQLPVPTYRRCKVPLADAESMLHESPPSAESIPTMSEVCHHVEIRHVGLRLDWYHPADQSQSFSLTLDALRCRRFSVQGQHPDPVVDFGVNAITGALGHRVGDEGQESVYVFLDSFDLKTSREKTHTGGVSGPPKVTATPVRVVMVPSYLAAFMGLGDHVQALLRGATTTNSHPRRPLRWRSWWGSFLSEEELWSGSRPRPTTRSPSPLPVVAEEVTEQCPAIDASWVVYSRELLQDVESIEGEEWVSCGRADSTDSLSSPTLLTCRGSSASSSVSSGTCSAHLESSANDLAETVSAASTLVPSLVYSLEVPELVLDYYNLDDVQEAEVLQRGSQLHEDGVRWIQIHSVLPATDAQVPSNLRGTLLEVRVEGARWHSLDDVSWQAGMKACTLLVRPRTHTTAAVVCCVSGVSLIRPAPSDNDGVPLWESPACEVASVEVNLRGPLLTALAEVMQMPSWHPLAEAGPLQPSQLAPRPGLRVLRISCRQWSPEDSLHLSREAGGTVLHFSSTETNHLVVSLSGGVWSIDPAILRRPPGKERVLIVVEDGLTVTVVGGCVRLPLQVLGLQSHLGDAAGVETLLLPFMAVGEGSYLRFDHTRLAFSEEDGNAGEEAMGDAGLHRNPSAQMDKKVAPPSLKPPLPQQRRQWKSPFEADVIATEDDVEVEEEVQHDARLPTPNGSPKNPLAATWSAPRQHSMRSLDDLPVSAQSVDFGDCHRLTPAQNSSERHRVTPTVGEREEDVESEPLRPGVLGTLPSTSQNPASVTKGVPIHLSKFTIQLHSLHIPSRHLEVCGAIRYTSSYPSNGQHTGDVTITDLSVLTRVGASAAAVTTILQPTTVQLTSTNWRHHAVAASDLKVDLSLMDIDLLHHLLRVELREVGKNLHYSNKTAAERQFLELINSTVSWKSAGDLTDPGVDESVVAGVPPSDVDNRSLATTSAIMEPLASLAAFASHISITVGDHRYPLLRLECGAFMYRRAVQTSAMHLQFIQAQDTRCDVYGRGRWDSVLLPVPSLTACVTHTVGRHSSNRHFTLKCQGLQLVASRLLISKGRFVVNQLKQATGRWIAAEAVGVASVSDSARLADVCDDVPEDPGSLLLASQKTSSSAPTPATSASTSTQGGHYTYALLAAESEGSATHRFVNSFNCAFFLMVGSEDGLQGDVHKLLPSSSVDLFIPYKHAATLYVYLYPVDCVDVSGHHHPTVRINRRGQLRDMTHARTALTELRYGAVTGIVVDDLLLVLSCRDAETEASAVAAADAHEDEPQPKLGYSTSPWMSSAASTTASGLPASSPVPVTATVAAGCAPMGKDRGSGVEEGDAGRVVVRVHAKLALRNESGTVLYVRQQAMDDMEGSPSSEKFAVVSRGWHYPLRAACEAVTIRLVHGGKVFEAVLSARGLRGGYYIALYPLSRTAAASRSTHTGGEEIERLCAAEDQRPVELYVVSTVLPGNASSTITLYPRLTVLNHIGVPIKVSIWQSDRRAGPPTAFDVEQQQMWMPNRRDNRRFLSDLIAVGVQEELQHRQAVPVHQCSYDSNLVLGLSLMQSTGEVIRTVALQEVVSSLTKAQHQQHPRHLLLQDAAGRTFHVLVTILPRTVVLSVGMWINNLTEYPLLLSDSLLTRRLSAGQAANTGIIPSRGIPFLIGTPSLQELDQAYFTIGLDGGWSDAVSMDVGSSGVFVSLQIKLGIPRSCNYAIELPNAMDGRPVVVNITPRWTIYNSTTKRMWLHVDFPGLSAARRLAAKAAAAEGPSALGRRNSSTIVSADEGARSSSVPTKGADAIAGVSSIATVALNPGEYHVSCVGTLQGNRLALQENLEGTVPSRSAITGSGMRHVDIATCYTSQQTDYISIDHPGQATFNLWAAPRSADTQVGVSYGASVVAHRSTAAYGPGAMEAADEACTVDAVVTGRVLVSVAPVEQVMAVVLHSIRATKICIQNRCRHTVVFVRQEGSRRRNVVPPTHNRFFLWEDSRGEHRIRVHLEGLKGMWFEVDLASGECQVTRRTTPGLAHYDSDIEAADFHVHGFTSADKSRVTVLVSHGEVPSYATSTAWRTSALLAVDLAFVQLSWLLGDSSTDLAAAGGQKARKGHHASASSPTSSGAHQLPRCLASLVMEGLHLEVLNTEDTRNLSATLHQLQVVDETGPSGPRVVVHRARLREEATDDAPMSGSDDANETDDTSTLASIPRHHHADTKPASRTSSTRSAIRHRLGKVFGGHRASTTTSTTSGADASATLFGAADRLLHLLLPDELNLSLRQDVELSYSLVKYADGLMRVTEANAALAPLVVVINDRWLAMALGEGRTLHNRGSRSTAGATTAVDLHRSTGGHPVSAAPATASMTFPTQPEFLAQMVRALRTEVCAAVGGSVRAPAAAGSAAGHGLGGAATSGGSTEVAHATPSAGGDSSDGASFLLIETLTLSRVTFFVTFQRDKSDPLRPLLGIYALMLPRDLHQTKLRWSSYTLSQQMGTMRSLRAGFQRWAIQGLREQWTKITRIDSVRQAFQLRRRPVPLRRAPVPLTMALVQLRRDAMGGTGELPFLSSASDEDDDGEELDGRV